MAKNHKHRQFVFVQYKQVDVIHPTLGVIDKTRNYELSFELFELLSQCNSHIIVRNVNPLRRTFVEAEILPRELFEVTNAPGNFVMTYLKEVANLKAKLRRFKSKQKSSQKALPLSTLLKLARRDDSTGEAGEPAVLLPSPPSAPGGSAKS
jgi:hypothetical protein